MRVYLQMKGKFNSGLDNVMVTHKDPVDSTHPMRGKDNGRLRWTRAPVYSQPIRVWGGSDVWTARFVALIGRLYDRLVFARFGRTSGTSI